MNNSRDWHVAYYASYITCAQGHAQCRPCFFFGRLTALVAAALERLRGIFLARAYARARARGRNIPLPAIAT
jgi:hypothetical protein